MNSGWLRIGDRLFDFSEQLARSYRAPYGRDQWKTLSGLLELLFYHEAQNRNAVDALARQLANTGKRPEEQSWEEYFLFLRLENACDFVAQLLVEDSQGRQVIPEPDNACTDAELIEWLLISIWIRRHDHWLKMTAQSLALNRPLYGLEDVPESPPPL